ncbi:cadherin-like domain-containing protein, partial [Marinobacterium sp. AK62]
LDNDTDPEGHTQTVANFTDPSNGTVTQNPDGSLTYTPDEGFSGEDTFTYTVTDSEGAEDTATVTVTVGPENQPPQADPVLTASNQDSDMVPDDFPVEGIAFFKKLDVGGGLDGVGPENDLQDPADLGGIDNETAESALAFDVTSLPAYGSLFIEQDGVFTELNMTNLNEGSSLIDTADAVYWVATHEQVLTGSSKTVGGNYTAAGIESSWEQEGVNIYARTQSGEESVVSFNANDGIGVIGTTGGPAAQLGYDSTTDQAEVLIVDFEQAARITNIDITHLIQGEGEVGKVEAYLDGNLVGSFTFSNVDGAADITLTPVALGTGNAAGSNAGSFDLGSLVTDQLRFSAEPYAGESDRENDSSDYFIGGITYEPVAPVEFNYQVIDEEGLPSDPVAVVINPSSSTPVPEPEPGYVTPVGGDDIPLQVDESDIPDTHSDGLAFTAGSDDLTGFAFSSDLNGLSTAGGLSWNWDSETQVTGSVNGSPVVTLTLVSATIAAGSTGNVQVTAELSDNLDHADIAGYNLMDLGSITVIGSTDADDTAEGTVGIKVVDDIIEITDLSNSQVEEGVAVGALSVDEGADELASLVFTGSAPSWLKTADGESVSYQSLENGSLEAVDEDGERVFLLSADSDGDGYTLTLDQMLQAPVVEAEVTINASMIDAGTPIGGETAITQNGVTVYLSSSGGDIAANTNPSQDGYGVDNTQVDEYGEAITYRLDAGQEFDNVSFTIGNFSSTGQGDTFYYQRYNDGQPIDASPQAVAAQAGNESGEFTINIPGDGYDQIVILSHVDEQGDFGSSYKVISMSADVIQYNSTDVILDFGIGVTDGDGDSHGGSFQVAIDTSGDGAYPDMDPMSLDNLVATPPDNNNIE